MNKKSSFPIVLFLGLTFCTFDGDLLIAQSKNYPYKKYKDRKEGLIKKKTLVAGEKLVLVGAAIDNSENIPANSQPAEYKLGFYLEEPTRVKIEVREFGSYYKMQPIQVSYKQGSNTFSWPSEIPLYYGIGLKDLYPLAKIRGRGTSKIVPIVLYHKNPESAEMSYSFAFIPNKAITELEYNILKSGSSEPVFNGKLMDLLREKIFYLRWSGKDMSGKPVASDSFVLTLKATFQPPPGSADFKTLTLSYRFYHFADLLKQRELTIK